MSQDFLDLRPRQGKRTPPAVQDVNLEDDDSYYTTRQPTSARRYEIEPSIQGNTRYIVHPDQVKSIPPRRSAQPQLPPGAARTTEDVPAARKRGWFRSHPLLWLGVGMLFMLFAWIGLSAFVSWWTTWQDDLHYGRPRTFQIDQVVGHNDSPTHPTHFIAINLNARVVIIEIPGGDTSKSKIYTSVPLLGQNATLYPVTLSFRDVNHDGKLDMIVHVQGDELIFLNENGQFVQQQPS